MKAHTFYKGSCAALETANFLQKSQIEIEKGKLENYENEDDEIDAKLTLQDFCKLNNIYFVLSSY